MRTRPAIAALEPSAAMSRRSIGRDGHDGRTTQNRLDRIIRDIDVDQQIIRLDEKLVAFRLVHVSAASSPTEQFDAVCLIDLACDARDIAVRDTYTNDIYVELSTLRRLLRRPVDVSQLHCVRTARRSVCRAPFTSTLYRVDSTDSIRVSERPPVAYKPHVPLPDVVQWIETMTV
jgi:hypothetical protein